ncbi:hypothetical protein CsSME_00049754 [Camellia sinensis var. sinensis]
MEVLAMVQSYLTERARVGQAEVTSELLVAKSKLEVVHYKVISLEFELESEQKKMGEVQKARDTAKERLEEVLKNNEELRNQALKDKEVANARVTKLERALGEERAKTTELARMMASERASYPDLCITMVEQFKSSPEFQMAIDAAAAKGLAREGEGRAGPPEVAVTGRTEEEIIQSFQLSNYYKYEMS